MRKPIFLALLASTALAGCAVEKQVIDHRTETVKEAETRLGSAPVPTTPADVSPIKVRDDVFVGGRPVRNENGEPLPSRFEKTNGITLVRNSPASLREIATALTDMTKIPVVIAASSVPMGSAAPAIAASGAAPAIGSPVAGGDLNQALSAISAGGAPAGGAGGGVISAPARVPSGTMSLNYSGRLSSLLNMVSANFNVAWRYEGGRIILESVVSRSFDVPSLPVIANLSFDLTSKGESSGEGGSQTAGQTAATKTASDIFKELQTGINTLAGGGSTSINTTTGVVSVTGDPATVARVGEYIKGMNERLNKQVAISVKVYTVALNGRDEFNLDVAGLLSKAGENGLSLGNGVASGGVVPMASAVASTVANKGAGLGWALLDTQSKFYGSNALVKALSTSGDVSVVTTASVTTVNGVPVPLQVGELRDYVKSVKTTTTGTSGTTETQIEPGTVNTGFNLHLVPRVDRNGDLLLQYGINISELTGKEDGFESFKSGNQTVQLRRLSQRNFIQQAKIPNGNTLVLAGFEQVRSNSEKQGTGVADFPLLGGSRLARMQREIVVIAITPTLLDLSAKN